MPYDKKTLLDLINDIMPFAEAMSKLSREEFIRAVFYTYPSEIPMSNMDRIKFINTANIGITAEEIQKVITPDEFTKWAENDHNDIESEDGHEFYNMFCETHFRKPVVMAELHKMIEEFMDKKYPTPLKRVVPSFNAMTMETKEYFLPALKVLNEDDLGQLWSPAFPSVWEKNELVATHMSYGNRIVAMYDTLHPNTDLLTAMKTCHCGIYASVNMEELGHYIRLDGSNNIMGWSLDDRFDSSHRRLCIVEPFSDAYLFMARKGWKASHVYVSEIVGETISADDASTLLSMVWHRPIDISKL